MHIRVLFKAQTNYMVSISRGWRVMRNSFISVLWSMDTSCGTISLLNAFPCNTTGHSEISVCASCFKHSFLQSALQMLVVLKPTVISGQMDGCNLEASTVLVNVFSPALPPYLRSSFLAAVTVIPPITLSIWSISGYLSSEMDSG